jgi:hypothetical protein
MDIRIGQLTTSIRPADADAGGADPALIEDLVRQALHRHERTRRARSLAREDPTGDPGRFGELR